MTGGGAIFAAFPAGLRDDLQRLLPRHHARALRPHPARRVARVPPPRPGLEQGLGRRLLRRQPRAGAPRRRAPWATSSAASRWTPTATTRAPSCELLNPYSLLVARHGAVPHRHARRRLGRAQVRGRAARARRSSAARISFWVCARARRGDVGGHHRRGLARVRQRVRPAGSAGSSSSSSRWRCSTRIWQMMQGGRRAAGPSSARR